MTQITLGLTTWSEHPALIDGQRQTTTLNEYAQHFPTVEIDTFFYALPKSATVQKWLTEVPRDFQFIVKAHRLMTQHENLTEQDSSLAEVFQKYRDAIMPLIAAGQLKCVLFQFPPFFDAQLDHIDYLRRIRLLMGNLPIAVEFRNASWYQPAILQPLTEFCRDLQLTLVAADEPHDTLTSVPFYLITTNPKLVMIRLHGRNREGWDHPDKEWRKKRTLYRYSSRELQGLATLIQNLAPAPQEICVIFNNNSGKDAAPNSLELQRILHLEFKGLAPHDPEQLNLF